MELLIRQTLNKLALPEVSFADVRVTRTDEEGIYFMNGFLRNYGSSMDSTAIGIRVLINGCWGFAGSRDLSPAALDRLVQTAVKNARQGGNFIRNKVEFPALPATRAEYHHQPEIDPFKLPKEEKTAYLSALAEAIKPSGKIVHSMVSAQFMRQEKYYANSEGTWSHTSYFNTLPVMEVVASDGNQIQSRTWPGHMSAGRGALSSSASKNSLKIPTAS